MRNVVFSVLASLTVAGCGTDPADVVLLEKARVEEVISTGQATQAAFSALKELGYACAASETGEAVSPGKSVCTMTTDPGKVNCAVAMRVVIAQARGKIDRVVVDGGNECV